jgi:hypothetical protein
MTRKEDRRGYSELAILLALLVPGAGLFFWGLHSCQEARHFGVPGAVAVVAGLFLALAGGFYHYRTDYRDKGRPEAGASAGRGRGAGAAGRLAFLVITLASFLAAVLAHRILLR